MDGGIAGTGRTDLQNSLPRPEVPANSRNAAVATHFAAADLVEDEIAGSLLNLANPEIGRLLNQMEQARLALDPAVLDALLRTVINAARSGDMPRAMAAISQMVAHDPERGPQLVREAAALAPMRSEVNELLQKLASTAKSEAEHILARASAAVENAPRTSAAEMLALAQRFLETGQHINFVRAAEMGQAILAFFPEHTPVDPRSPEESGARRRPVLSVLGWIALGLLLLAAALMLLLNRQ